MLRQIIPCLRYLPTSNVKIQHKLRQNQAQTQKSRKKIESPSISNVKIQHKLRQNKVQTHKSRKKIESLSRDRLIQRIGTAELPSPKHSRQNFFPKARNRGAYAGIKFYGLTLSMFSINEGFLSSWYQFLRRRVLSFRSRFYRPKHGLRRGCVRSEARCTEVPMRPTGRIR